MKKLTKKEIDILEKAFSAEINSALNKELPIIQTQSKIANELCEKGFLKKLSINFNGILVSGYYLTMAGNIAYCSSEKMQPKITPIDRGYTWSEEYRKECLDRHILATRICRETDKRKRIEMIEKYRRQHGEEKKECLKECVRALWNLPERGAAAS